MKPTVTIGVCVKNCEALVKDAIDSILGQDFPHELMEVLFLDDGSEDNTLSVIKDCVSRMDMQVKVYHQEWRGLGPARNVVVNNARGDYIVWVDHDMTLSRDYVRRQVEFMEHHPAVGIAKGKYGLVQDASLVATFENIGKMIDLNYEGEASSKPLGTGGCIYRVKAIRQVGGFDENIKGAGEDMDAEYRIKAAGWLLYVTQASFWDHERREITWNTLWQKYFWYGYSGHYIVHKDKDIECVYEMIPPAAFLSGLLRSFVAYKLTHRRVVFLLPLHYTFKMTAWFLGFAKSHILGYGH